MQDDIIAAIVAWPEKNKKETCDFQALVHHVGKSLNGTIRSKAVLEAIRVLQDRQLIELVGTKCRLREADLPERDLYDLLEAEFTKTALRENLGLRAEAYVFQKTATGGPLGSGLLSKPDFTLAAIQSWRFDPERTLEVYSFEVKNRAGAAINAVYEAVAHGRLVHHPYLVCPRSQLDAAFNEGIQKACEHEGVGLILFDLAVEHGTYSLDRFTLAARPQRRSPDPWLVQQHLENRLTQDNQEKLAAFATEASCPERLLVS